MMAKRPVSVNVTLLLILLNALFWTVFGIIVLLGVHPGIPDQAIIRWAMAVLSIGCSIVEIVLLFFLVRRSKIAYYLSVVLFATLSVLTITDDFGISDLLYLLPTTAALVLLVIRRRWFMQLPPDQQPGS
jgi:hypothetical protein